jgi:hypothetical protein
MVLALLVRIAAAVAARVLAARLPQWARIILYSVHGQMNYKDTEPYVGFSLKLTS